MGKAVSDDYIWDLFNRHNWKKKCHNLNTQNATKKRNKEAQEEFKNLPEMLAAQPVKENDNRSLMVFVKMKLYLVGWIMFGNASYTHQTELLLKKNKR